MKITEALKIANDSVSMFRQGNDWVVSMPFRDDIPRGATTHSRSLDYAAARQRVKESKARVAAVLLGIYGDFETDSAFCADPFQDWKKVVRGLNNRA